MKTVQPRSLFLEQWGVSCPRYTEDNPANSDLKAALSAWPVWPSILGLFSLMLVRWLGPGLNTFTLQVGLSENNSYLHINSTPTIQTVVRGDITQSGNIIKKKSGNLTSRTKFIHLLFPVILFLHVLWYKSSMSPDDFSRLFNGDMKGCGRASLLKLGQMIYIC